MRLWGKPLPDEAPGAPMAGPALEERSSPGLRALFEPLSSDGRHSILDLGHAESRRLRLLGRFARRIRFAGLVPEPPSGRALREGLRGLALGPVGSYDVVLAWDVLDWLGPDDRQLLVDRVVALTGPGARLYTSVTSSDVGLRIPSRLELTQIDRVTVEPLGPPEAMTDGLLPGQVERLVAPFEVMSAFSLRAGVREYVAVRR